MYDTVADMLKDGKKVILVHGNADMDAVGSAYAIARTFGNCEIYAPAGIDRVAKTVIDKMNIQILEDCDISGYDLVVAVDTSSPEQYRPKEIDVPAGSIVIDHHTPTGKWKDMVTLCDDSMTSCTEIVLRLIKHAGLKPDRDTALALVGGMITDGGHFQFANSTLLRDFADLMDEFDINMEEAFMLTRTEMSMSERVATMKCIERSKFDRVGDMIVATSMGGSFEASGCRALLSSGADVVFVASQREDTFRLSARTTQEMVKRGIHLGEILNGIGEETLTDGGGHNAAAGMTGTGDAEAMLHICMQRTMDEFRRIKKSMYPAE